MFWKVEGEKFRIEKLERMIRVLKIAINTKQKRFSLRQRKDDLERLSTFQNILDDLKDTTKGAGGVASTGKKQ